jgi:hypothetical protein
MSDVPAMVDGKDVVWWANTAHKLWEVLEGIEALESKPVPGHTAAKLASIRATWLSTRGQGLRGRPMPTVMPTQEQWAANFPGVFTEATQAASEEPYVISRESTGPNVVQVGNEKHHLGEDGQVVMIETPVDIGHSGWSDRYSEQDVLKILSNVGIDIKCGACLEIAFTGVTMATHGCSYNRPGLYPWEESEGLPLPGAKPWVLCKGCGCALLTTHRRVADGCPCNSPRGINHGLVPKNTCTCVICDPAQTGGTRYPVQAHG